jgi:hypothetical protein
MKMLGEQITDLKGKVTGQRVLDAECPTIEKNVVDIPVIDNSMSLCRTV